MVTSLTYAGSLAAEITQGYDNNFWLSTLSYAGESTALSYDNDGLLTGINGFTIARHNDHGLPESVSDNKFNQTRTYNLYGEATNVIQTINNKRSYDYNLSYNLLGQITSKTETLFDGTVNQLVYGYDEKSRLVSVSNNNVEIEHYEYDANGNRLKHSVSARGISEQVASYNIGDQLQSNGDTQFEYDDNGRLSKKTNDSAIEEYRYSSQGRLLSVKFFTDSILDKTISYQHNALGNRVAKLVDGVIYEKYLWLNKTTLAAVYDKDDNLLQRFEYTLSNTPSSFTQDNNKYYISSDQVGTPRIITAVDGTVVKTMEYDAFGNVINDSNPDFTIPFGFAGGLRDSDTNLLRFGYRDYSPETGRWTARDPIVFAGGDTNLYGYVASDPINFIDPTGLISIGGYSYSDGVYSKGGFSFNSNDNSASYSNGPITVTVDKFGNKTIEGEIKRGDSSCTVSGGGFNCSINAGPVQCNVTVDSENNVTSFDTSINYGDILTDKVLNPYSKGLDVGLGAADALKDAANNSIINWDATRQQQMKELGI